MAFRLRLAGLIVNKNKSLSLKSPFSLSFIRKKEEFEIEEILKRKGAVEGEVDPPAQPLKYPPVELRQLGEDLISPEPFIVNEVSGVPKEHVHDRVVRIAKESKNAMQSGTNNTHGWVISFDNRARWENNLMGWVSTGDPLSNLVLRFPSAEEAIFFCEKHSYPYHLVDDKPVSPKKKLYASNFSWNKRSRVSTK